MDRRAILGLAAVAVSATPAMAGGPKAKSAPTNSFLRQGTITGAVTRSGGRRGVMTVETGIDVADEALRTRADQSGPRLRAAYNAVVQRHAAELLPGAPPQVDRLSRELQAATDRVLGRAGARLLLGTVMVA
jgi:flagellar basal body-associated protein FliL